MVQKGYAVQRRKTVDMSERDEVNPYVVVPAPSGSAVL